MFAGRIEWMVQSKSNAVNFRCKSNTLTEKSFNTGAKVIQVENPYVYLGPLLTQHLDYYNMMAKHVSKSGSRTLEVVILNFKAFGGLPYNTFTKLYDSVVWSTISYGAAICGDWSSSCKTAIQNRAARYFLEVGPYTPNAAIMGDMGWSSTEV